MFVNGITANYRFSIKFIESSVTAILKTKVDINLSDVVCPLQGLGRQIPMGRTPRHRRHRSTRLAEWENSVG